MILLRKPNNKLHHPGKEVDVKPGSWQICGEIGVLELANYGESMSDRVISKI